MTGRFVEHFIPTHSSWLNLVERWFSEATTKSIRRSFAFPTFMHFFPGHDFGNPLEKSEKVVE